MKYTHENDGKSSIGMIHLTNPHINAKTPPSLLWLHKQSAYAYTNEGFLKKSLVLETSAIYGLTENISTKKSHRSKDETYPKFNKSIIQQGWIYPLTDKCTATHLI